jgi:hypothetical protein
MIISDFLICMGLAFSNAVVSSSLGSFGVIFRTQIYRYCAEAPGHQLSGAKRLGASARGPSQVLVEAVL